MIFELGLEHTPLRPNRPFEPRWLLAENIIILYCIIYILYHFWLTKHHKTDDIIRDTRSSDALKEW